MLKPDDEQPFLTTALATRLAVVEVRSFARATYPPNDIDLLRELPSNLTTADQQAAFLVGYCLDSGWKHNPSLLEQTLTALITAGVEVATLGPIRDRVRVRIDPVPNPIGALWLEADMPFFSRGNLRPLVENLLTADAQPILQIAGPPQDGEECGKSYTREFLDYVGTRARKDVHVVFAEIPKGTGPSYSVEELADALVTPTNRDISTRPPRAATGRRRRPWGRSRSRPRCGPGPRGLPPASGPGPRAWSPPTVPEPLPAPSS